MSDGFDPPHPKRVKGRPQRGSTEVGRDKLIEAARAILQVRTPPEVSRKAVAEAAGVSPALVTYYFPDKTSLVTAATQPLIGRRVMEMLDILASPTTQLARLREIARLFLSLSEAERTLIDVMGAFGHYDETGSPSRSVLATARERLTAFHAEGVEAGVWRAVDGRVFVAAIWGMCNAVAGQGPADQKADSPARDAQVDTVVDFALNGMTSRHAA